MYDQGHIEIEKFTQFIIKQKMRQNILYDLDYLSNLDSTFEAF